MHLGSWIQLYTILHSGTSPDTFQCFQTYNGRPPELVCGSTYPLLGVDPENYGTICLGPDNRSDAARITFKPDPAVDVWEVAPLFGVELWFGRLATMQLMVAPLVFRHHAVFKDLRAPNSAPYVAVDFDTTPHPPYDVSRYPVDLGNTNPVERQFINAHGCYTLANTNAHRLSMPFGEAHECLVPIGTFMLVETSAIQQFGIGSPKPWIRGSLRYPDETLDEGVGDHTQLRIYVTLRIRTRAGEEGDVRVIYIPPSNCRIFAEMRVTEADYSIDAAKHIIRAQGAAVAALP
jgi:hypothetical protein